MENIVFRCTIVVYLVIYLLVFLGISRLNRSYLNAYTISMGYVFILQGMGLFLESFKRDFTQDYSFKVLLIFVASLIIGTLFQYFGYKAGFGFNNKLKYMNSHVSVKTSSRALKVCMVFMILAFLILGIRGVGIYEWLFNTRNAYISGRAGNGIFYVLFEIFLCTSLAMACYLLLKKKKGKNKYILLVLILLGVTYFTGSKGFMLASVLLLVYLFDMFKKRISFKTIFCLGLIALLAINLLLLIQSNITILDYMSGDFYNNYLNEIEAISTGEMQYHYGQIFIEDLFYGFMPRNIFPNKPYIYGTSRLPAFFFGEQTVIDGNTPSFSSYGAAYADFGLFGVAVSAFASGFFLGIIEGAVRSSFRRYGLTFFGLMTYQLLILTTIPVSNIILIAYLVLLYILIKHKKRPFRYNTAPQIRRPCRAK